MRTERFTCDQCGIEKGETNHWFILFAGANGFEMRPWPDRMEGAYKTSWRHICGQNCASILLARWMATGKLDKPSGEDSSK